MCVIKRLTYPPTTSHKMIDMTSKFRGIFSYSCQITHAGFSKSYTEVEFLKNIAGVTNGECFSSIHINVEENAVFLYVMEEQGDGIPQEVLEKSIKLTELLS